MKTSSDGERALDKATAHACMVTNLFVLPGLGSLAAGRRVGYLQAALALLGFGGTLGWLLWFARDWVARGAPPLEFNGALMLGIAGVGLFLAAWLWALGTSLRLEREAREASAPPVLPSPSDESSPSPPPVLPRDES